MRYMRQYEVTTSDRAEAFVFTFDTAHEKARVERVETKHTARGDIGVLWVRDRGDPSEMDGKSVIQAVICVPFRAGWRHVAVPDDAGEFLGAFQDREVRWLVFARRGADERTGTPPKPAPEKVSVQAAKPAAPDARKPSSPNGPSVGNRPAQSPKRNP